MSSEATPRDIAELGYPAEVLEAVQDVSEQQFRRNVERFGAGKNWLDGDEARWHLWKACDELFQARDSLDAADRWDGDEGDLNVALANYADALNHMLMAYEIAESRVNDS